MDFLNDEDGNPDDNGFSINKAYADRYDKWRKDEELQKLKDKYGENFAEDSSSTSEEEDDNAVELTDEIEKGFFKTLSCLKQKDPKIYDESITFFKANDENKDKLKKPNKKPEESLTMAAYQRKMLLETNGVIEEENELKFDDMPLVEQEKQIKDSFKDALKDSDSDDDGVGGLFKTRVKTKEEIAKDEANYKNWLSGQNVSVPNDEKKDFKGLRDYWTDPKLDESEKFLRDYILNQRYLEKGGEEAIDHDFSDSGEDEIAQQEEFERKFNFRFEEPDQEFIKRYPRTVEQSMRKKDDKRKIQRETLKARKQAERAQKDEELKRLKALKRAEILEKIKKLQEVTGNEDLTFQEKDIDGEFDPEEHDKRMSELFDQDFYKDQADDEKPEFPELDEELEIEKWDEWQGEPEEEAELHCEDPGFVMDCDYDPKSVTQQELLENTRRKKKRRQSKFAAALSRPKPVFDPKSSSYEKYLDEYYSLNYEDLIGDIPCRFKYRKVVPNDFGLTVEEILSAPDKELNRWASVKKIMRRRPEHVEIYEQKAYKKKAMNINAKKNCIPSLYSTPPDDDNDQAPNDAGQLVKPAALKTKLKKKLGKSKEKTDASNPIPNCEAIKKKEKKMNSTEGVAEETMAAQKRKLADKQVHMKKKKKKINNHEGGAVSGKKEDVVLSNTIHKKKKISQTDNGISSKKKIDEKKVKRKWKNLRSPSAKRKDLETNPLSSLSDARLKSYGINPKKFKNKLKYGNKK